MYKDVILWHPQLKELGPQMYKSRVLYIVAVKLVKLKLECFNFRMLNVIPIVSTKKTVIEYTQKEIRIKLK